jgi:hypothetical protein
VTRWPAWCCSCQGGQSAGLARLGSDAEGYRDAGGVQGWTWSKPKSSMGLNFTSACKVFEKMAEREKFSNFENSFGGSHSYIHRDGMVVVVNLVLFCKFSKSGSSSLYFKVPSCQHYTGQPGQH